MTIAEMRERSNRAISRLPQDLLILGIVLLSSSAAFGLGMLAGRDMGAGRGTDGLWIENIATTTLPAQGAAAASAPIVSSIPAAPAGAVIMPETGKYVASKNGTKYYLPSCSAANRIKESNRVWFASKEEAEASGRTPATNCPGL